MNLPTNPKQPHLVYGNDPSNMRVMYVSSSDFPRPMVLYWNLEDIHVNVSIGSSATYSAIDICEEAANIEAQNLFRDPGFTHTVEMNNLEPDTRYYYQVGNDEHGWSDIYTFRSAPNHSRSVRFVAFGDEDITEA